MSDTRPANLVERPEGRRFSNSTRLVDSPTRHDIFVRLATVDDPQFGDDLVSLGLVESVEISDEVIVVQLGLYAPRAPKERRILENVYSTLDAFDREIVVIAADCAWKRSKRSQIPGVRNVVPVVGARDGAGTTGVATSVAFELEQQGARVGVLKLEHRQAIPPETGTVPPTVRGVRVLSSGAFQAANGELSDGRLECDRPSELVERLCFDVTWTELDYLFVDVATDDSALRNALFQLVDVAGAVVTTTRSDSTETVRHRIERLRTSGVTPLGVVETGQESVREERSDLCGCEPGTQFDDRSEGVVLETFPVAPVLSTESESTLVNEERDQTESAGDIAARVADAVGGVKRCEHAGLSLGEISNAEV